MLGETVRKRTQPVNRGQRQRGVDADHRLPVTALGPGRYRVRGRTHSDEPLKSPRPQLEHIGAILERVVDGLIRDAERRVGGAIANSVGLRRLRATLRAWSQRGAA